MVLTFSDRVAVAMPPRSGEPRVAAQETTPPPPPIIHGKNAFETNATTTTKTRQTSAQFFRGYVYSTTLRLVCSLQAQTPLLPIIDRGKRLPHTQQTGQSPLANHKIRRFYFNAPVASRSARWGVQWDQPLTGTWLRARSLGLSSPPQTTPQTG